MAEQMRDQTTLFYDQQCPICRYAVQDKLPQLDRPIARVDLRSDDPRIPALWSAGYDLNRGFVITDAGRQFYGWRALQFLANTQVTRHWWTRLGFALMRLSGVARSVYGLLVAVRWVLLKWLKVPPLTRSP
jgi:predicted DCC family thiol-disulfide oxidoreductase YuxK